MCCCRISDSIAFRQWGVRDGMRRFAVRADLICSQPGFDASLSSASSEFAGRWTQRALRSRFTAYRWRNASACSDRPARCLYRRVARIPQPHPVFPTGVDACLPNLIAARRFARLRFRSPYLSACLSFRIFATAFLLLQRFVMSNFVQLRRSICITKVRFAALEPCIAASFFPLRSACVLPVRSGHRTSPVRQGINR
jgi:hypothetical protein